MPQPLNTSSPHNRWQAVEAPKQDPQKRAKNFTEVILGYSEEQALAEASRCLTCPNPQCVTGCPVGVDIPAFIKLIKAKKLYAKPSQKSKKKTVSQPSADEFALKKSNAKKTA